MEKRCKGSRGGEKRGKRRDEKEVKEERGGRKEIGEEM